MNSQIKEAAQHIRAAKQLLVFTGAGISAESGIPTFRDDQGFWREFPPEQFASWSGLRQTAAVNPQRFAAFVQAVIGPIGTAQPNAAHLAVAAAEKHRELTVVTQNIDGLHQEAGSTVVHEVHGSLLEIITEPRGMKTLITRQELLNINAALESAQAANLGIEQIMQTLNRLFGLDLNGVRHPNLVLFGDLLAEPAWSLAKSAASTTDCLLQIGCSRVVWPASTLPDIARRAGAKIIAIDPNHSRADVWIEGTAATVTPALFRVAFEMQ